MNLKALAKSLASAILIAVSIFKSTIELAPGTQCDSYKHYVTGQSLDQGRWIDGARLLEDEDWPSNSSIPAHLARSG